MIDFSVCISDHSAPPGHRWPPWEHEGIGRSKRKSACSAWSALLWSGHTPWFSPPLRVPFYHSIFEFSLQKRKDFFKIGQKTGKNGQSARSFLFYLLYPNSFLCFQCIKYHCQLDLLFSYKVERTGKNRPND